MKHNITRKVVLVPLFIMVLALLCILTIILAVNVQSTINNELYDIVNEAIFNTTNTEEDYRILTEACIDRVESQYLTYNNVDNKLSIEEDTYVENGDKATNNSTNVYNQAETTYYLDMITITFVNDYGEIKTAASFLDKTTMEISTADITDINKFSMYNEYNSNEYLYTLGNIIVDMIKCDDVASSAEIGKDYFVSNTFGELVVNIDNSSKHVDNADVSFIKIGKSSTELEYNDRILMQLEVDDKDRSIYTNILIKLNSDGKIFDMNII